MAAMAALAALAAAALAATAAAETVPAAAAALLDNKVTGHTVATSTKRAVLSLPPRVYNNECSF